MVTKIPDPECIVQGCVNRNSQGRFIGELCALCHKYLITGIVGPTTSFLKKIPLLIKENAELKEKLKANPEVTSTHPAVTSVWTSPIPSTPHRCPVCFGKGIVPNGFYKITDSISWASSDAAVEQCRGSSGVGIIYS